MDAVGPLQRTEKGNKCVLRYVDSFCKYAEAIPLPDISAVTCARAYATQIITRHGVNNVLVTDNGKSFTATFLMKSVRFWESSIIRPETGHTNEWIGR
jgi:hypothetical protein